jgi:hypothetical protein
VGYTKETLTQLRENRRNLSRWEKQQIFLAAANSHCFYRKLVPRYVLRFRVIMAKRLRKELDICSDGEHLPSTKPCQAWNMFYPRSLARARTPCHITTKRHSILFRTWGNIAKSFSADFTTSHSRARSDISLATGHLLGVHKTSTCHPHVRDLWGDVIWLKQVDIHFVFRLHVKYALTWIWRDCVIWTRYNWGWSCRIHGKSGKSAKSTVFICLYRKNSYIAKDCWINYNL